MKTVELIVNNLLEECSTHFWTSVSQWLNTLVLWSVVNLNYNLQSITLNVLKKFYLLLLQTGVPYWACIFQNWS